MATIIEDGINQGFYRIPNTLSSEKGPSFSANASYGASFGQPNLYLAMREQQLALENAAGTGQNVYYRYHPGPGKDIVELNNRPPFVDGYYYVRRNDSVDLRKQLYALETNRVPSTGNTEVFNTSLDAVVPPDDYCPYYIDPCPRTLDWCVRCSSRGKTALPRRQGLMTPIVARWAVLLVFVMGLAAIITYVV